MKLRISTFVISSVVLLTAAPAFVSAQLMKLIFVVTVSVFFILPSVVHAAFPPAFPKSSSVGVPSGTVLTNYTGSCTISTANTVIDAKNITCYPLLINAQNVTITRSYIQGYVGVNTNEGVYGTGSINNSLIIKDSTIFGSSLLSSNNAETGIGEKNWTAKRVKITGFRRMAHCLRNCTIEDSYLMSDVVIDPNCSACAVEPTAIHASAMRIGPGPATIKRSTLGCNIVDVGEGGCSANITVYGEYGQVHDVTIENNLLVSTGGGYCAYGGNTHGRTDAYNIIYRNNRWGRRNVDNTLGNSEATESGGQTCGYYGSISSMNLNPGNVWSGNYYYNNGGILGLNRDGTATGFDVTQPTAPTGLFLVRVSGSQNNLSWTASSDNSGISGYYIERCDGNNCWDYNIIAQTTGVGTTYSDIGLVEGTNYTYRIMAIDTNNNFGEFSGKASNSSDIENPTTPINLSATSVSTSQINLSWTASTDNVGIVGYDIQRCSGAGCTPSGTVYQTTGTGTTYQSTGLSPFTLYRYHVRARDAAGNTSNYSSVAQATTQANLILAPSNLRILQ